MQNKATYSTAFLRSTCGRVLLDYIPLVPGLEPSEAFLMSGSVSVEFELFLEVADRFLFLPGRLDEFRFGAAGGIGTKTGAGSLRPRTSRASTTWSTKTRFAQAPSFGELE